MWKKLALGVALGVVACSLLGGCGSGGASKVNVPKEKLTLGKLEASYYMLENKTGAEFYTSCYGVVGDRIYAYNEDKSALQVYAIKGAEFTMKNDNLIPNFRKLTAVSSNGKFVLLANNRGAYTSKIGEDKFTQVVKKYGNYTTAPGTNHVISLTDPKEGRIGEFAEDGRIINMKPLPGTVRTEKKEQQAYMPNARDFAMDKDNYYCQVTKRIVYADNNRGDNINHFFAFGHEKSEPTFVIGPKLSTDVRNDLNYLSDGFTAVTDKYIVVIFSGASSDTLYIYNKRDGSLVAKKEKLGQLLGKEMGAVYAAEGDSFYIAGFERDKDSRKRLKSSLFKVEL